MRAPALPALRSILLAGVLAALPLPALAQVTAEEAARLQALGETYFGKAPKGEPGTVTVVTEGDHYRAAIDFGLMVRRVIGAFPAAAAEKTKDFTFEWGPATFALAPRSDGLWRMWDHRLPGMKIKIGEQTTVGTIEGFEGEALFDPATGFFPSMNARFAKMQTLSTMAKPEAGMRLTADDVRTALAFEGVTKATAAPGVADFAIRQQLGGFAYGVEITDGAASGIPDMKITLTTGRQDDAAGMHGLRHAALLDLWAHLVAHHAPEDFTTGQGALKAKIAAALPVFTDLTDKSTFADIMLESPFGVLKAAKGTFDIDLAGVTREGKFAFGAGLAGFQAYSMFMPKWAQKLVPADMTVAMRAEGWDAATPLNIFLDRADFASGKPIDPETSAKIAAAALPRGVVDISVDGNRIASSLYDITVDGRLSAGPAGAKGAVTVKAKGIDKVADVLAAPDADEHAKQVGAMIAMARQFAERKGDLLVWRFDFDGANVAVNGKPLK